MPYRQLKNSKIISCHNVSSSFCAQECLVKKRAHGNTYSFPEDSYASSCMLTTQELNAQMRGFVYLVFLNAEDIQILCMTQMLRERLQK